MDFGTIIILVLAAVIVAGVFVVLITLRIRVAKAVKRSKILRQSENSALWASALVTDVQSDEVSETASKAHLMLTLEVTPPQGSSYQATAMWLVDKSALHLASPGSHVPVKLVAADSEKILPAVPWASYVGR